MGSIPRKCQRELKALREDCARVSAQIRAITQQQQTLEMLIHEMPISMLEMKDLVIKKLEFQREVDVVPINDETEELVDSNARKREEVETLIHVQEWLKQNNATFRSDIVALQEERAALDQQRQQLKDSLPSDEALTFGALRARVSAIEKDCELCVRDIGRAGEAQRAELEGSIGSLRRECEEAQVAVGSLAATVRDLTAVVDHTRRGTRRTLDAFRAAEEREVDALSARLRAGAERRRAT